MENIEMILTGLIEPHPDNPRKDLGDLKELTESIRKNGIYQNLTVVPRRVPMVGDDKLLIPGQIQRCSNPAEKERMQEAFNAGLKVIGYTVVIGHRRLAAAKEADLKKIPCVVVEMAPQKQIETMILENMQRADLTIYEQVKGFQQLLNFGETAEGIAEKTGFSVRTVKRRTEIARLDPDKLEMVMRGRAKQITLDDFDKLAKIEDLEERNKVLDDIGTNNFKFSLATADRRQKIKKAMPDVEKWLTERNAKRLEENASLINYDAIGKFWPGYEICKWEKEKETIPATDADQLYYIISRGEYLKLLKKKPAGSAKKEKPKRSAAEIKKEKQMNAAWDYLIEQSSLTYGLRKNFIEGLKVTKNNYNAMMEGALAAGILCNITYGNNIEDELCRALGMPAAKANEMEHDDLALEAIRIARDPKNKEKLPLIIWALFDDSEGKIQGGNVWRGRWPTYETNAELIALYEWLESVGYEISETERGLIQGTDINYHLGDAEKEVAK